MQYSVAKSKTGSAVPKASVCVGPVLCVRAPWLLIAAAINQQLISGADLVNMNICSWHEDIQESTIETVSVDHICSKASIP